jgi:CRP-like cAMP-binding protein
MPQNPTGAASCADQDLQGFLQSLLSCTAEVAASIAGRAKQKAYPVRAVIIKQGDRSGATFLLVAGRAHAVKYGVEGQMVLLRQFQTGDFFGAIAQTVSAPEDTEVVAVEVSRAAMFACFDFVVLIETHGCVGLAVSRALLHQLRAADEKVMQRSTLSAAGRVYAELLSLPRQSDGRSIRPAPVLSKLAVNASTTRETASRAVNALLRRGIVRRERGALVIVAPHRLEEMVI